MKLYDDMVIKGGRVIAKSYAKINLTLDVLGRLENGYHEVKMIMQSLNLFDLLIIDKQKSGITLSTSCHFIPDNFKNIAYQAADLFFKTTKLSGGAKILIHKNIPVAAGLAGGSGNAAAVLCALNLLYNTKLSDGELANLALKLGADVPYCIFGGTYLAEGIGEKLTLLPTIENIPIVLVKPSESISTAAIYNAIDNSKELIHPDTEQVISAIKNNDIKAVSKNLSNIMETVTSDKCPEISKIKKQLLSLGALGAVMSGSGPTVYGIFPDNASAKTAHDELVREYPETFVVHTIK